MKVTLGKAGLNKTWQAKFPLTTKCCKCKGKARIGFVAHEGIDECLPFSHFICSLHETKGKKGALWLHDCCAVAVYFCRDCLEPTALANQA